MTKLEKGVALFVLLATIYVLMRWPAAEAHSSDQIDEWLDAWDQHRIEHGLTPEHLDVLFDFRTRHYCHFIECPEPRATTTRSYSPPKAALSEAAVTDIIAAYFPANQVEKAKRVAWCESRWIPNAQNRRSSAGGLFQFLDDTWTRMGGGDKYDPWRNTQLAAKLWGQSGWAPWSCGGA